MNKIKGVLKLVVSLGLCFGVAFMASKYEPGAWYENLAKPSWTPPNWLFGPVWSLLYLMMAIAAWLIWKQNDLAAAKRPLIAFILQLFLNGLWSWIFFGEHLIGLAFFELVLLWAAIFMTLILFWKRLTLAGVLFIPYLLWVTFAGALNFAIWGLNS